MTILCILTKILISSNTSMIMPSSTLSTFFSLWFMLIYHVTQSYSHYKSDVWHFPLKLKQKPMCVERFKENNKKTAKIITFQLICWKNCAPSGQQEQQLYTVLYLYFFQFLLDFIHLCMFSCCSFFTVILAFIFIFCFFSQTQGIYSEL